MRQQRFTGKVQREADLIAVKDRYGVPETLRSCHTALVGGYVVEGHVPVEAIRLLLTERPASTGIALPGMPEGSPGMPGKKAGPLDVYAWGQQSTTLFGSY
ncbi:MAG: DUF411 domain-containing protein [Chloroflexi bacterium]|nr:DUF411 domain-containing protein [Chloroflexota bacterium]